MTGPQNAPLDELSGRLTFIQEAERLKNVLRSAHTSSGRPESTAEHSWRLCLLALTCADLLGPLDMAHLLKLCIVHDLGEAIHGDIPAVDQSAGLDKAGQERKDLATLTRSLPPALQQEIMGLWEDYERGVSREARIVKALDKLETLIQHNQGANPPDFDYGFNLEYGRRHTAADPILAMLRARIDEDTRRNLARRERGPQAPPAAQEA